MICHEVVQGEELKRNHLFLIIVKVSSTVKCSIEPEVQNPRGWLHIKFGHMIPSQHQPEPIPWASQGWQEGSSPGGSWSVFVFVFCICVCVCVCVYLCMIREKSSMGSLGTPMMDFSSSSPLATPCCLGLNPRWVLPLSQTSKIVSICCTSSKCSLWIQRKLGQNPTSAFIS